MSHLSDEDRAEIISVCFQTTRDGEEAARLASSLLGEEEPTHLFLAASEAMAALSEISDRFGSGPAGRLASKALERAAGALFPASPDPVDTLASLAYGRRGEPVRYGRGGQPILYDRDRDEDDFPRRGA